MNETNRRQFLTTLAAATGVASPHVLSAEPAQTSSALFLEAARELPVNSDADVIVCGAGPAGVTAAITAARAGAKVQLFEVHGALGGVWTNSLLGYLIDFDKPGFNQELVRKLRERDAICGEVKYTPNKAIAAPVQGLGYHPEEMKLLLEELAVLAGVKVQYHTRVVAAHREGRRLTTIITESKSGRQAWKAPVFIDTTGDGDLGAQAGCAFEIGVEKACPCQPLSMNVLLLVKDVNALSGLIHGATSTSPQEASKAGKALLAEIRRAGVDPSYGKPILFPVRGNLISAMFNHEYGINATDAAAVSEATLRARREMNQIIRALRKLGGAWEGVQIVATPEQIGIRDGRRILGRYVVRKEDLIQGAVHEDSVVKSHGAVDVHSLKVEDKARGYDNFNIQTQPYDIPLRALIARDVDGLLMAGRCISGDFIAHSSYRVTGNAVPMGEAAGATAAVAVNHKTAPHDVPWSEVKSVIEKVRAQA